MKIRKALPQDDQRIGELLIESFVSTYARKMPEVVVTESRKNDLRDIAHKRETGAVFVAELEAPEKPAGQIVGTVSIFPVGDPTSRAWTPSTADLRYMAVDPAHQGLGISKFLIDAALEQAKSWGLAAVCLHVRRGAVGVASVYTRYGFIRHPEGDVDMLPEIFLEAHLFELKNLRSAP